MSSDARPTAVVLANDLLQTPFAKTAHGMVRGPSRYRVATVIDETCAGADAGELVDGRNRGIPVRASVRDLLEVADERPCYCVIGVATSGGTLPEELRVDLLAAAKAGMTLVNGLHQLLADDLEIAAAVSAGGGDILDLRRPRAVRDLRFWTGEVLELATPRIAVLGTDCALGKRTTCALLVAALAEIGVRGEMIYTGQTGWLQGAGYGFILDATVNDFVCGELEGAILACAREAAPDVILLEGQSALRNPGGPCGAELILGAAAQGVILQHAPGRVCFEELREMGRRIPPVEEEVELIRLLGGDVWAVTLNHEGLEPDEAIAVRAGMRDRLEVPCVLPLIDGVEEVAEIIRRRIASDRP